MRSAADLVADLKACRQFRHLTDADREAIAEQAFHPHRHEYQPPKYNVTKTIPCDTCGRPKTDNGCTRCLACSRNAATERVVWASDAFAVAMQHHGYSCDTCAVVIEVADEDARRAGDRALDNLDGLARLFLCKECSKHFKAFATREFDREARSRFDRDLEKIMVAFIASRLQREARRFVREARDV